MVAQKLGEALGQPMVVENRAGASGTLGVDAVTKSPPDGYTLLMTTGDFATVTSLMPKMAFDPHKDLIAVPRFATVPLLLLTHPASGVGSVKELIEKAKAEPGKFAYASPGPGTINQLAAEWFALEAGIKLLHVPYRGGAQMATGLAGGEVPLGGDDAGTVQGPLEAGRIKALALLGRNGYRSARDADHGRHQPQRRCRSQRRALRAGQHACRDRLALDAAVLRILQGRVAAQAFNELGMEVAPISQAALTERIRADAARYQSVIEQTGVKLN